MRTAAALAVASLPGALLAVTALVGWSPRPGDAPSYFVPLRERTAAVLRGERSPWWNPDSGCGEPYFANPQTAVLYPPAWPALLLPATAAVGVEAGLHLALLAAGAAALALALGCGQGWAVAAGWGAALAGPSIDAVGVLNNLETLAWLPWLWWAAASGRLRWLPPLVAAAWLGAEPQLAALGMLMALTLARSRRAVLALSLGLGLVAVQAVPFLAWVAGGDRGPGSTPSARGALDLGQLPGLAFPGGGALPPDGFVAHPTLPLWALILGVAALWRCRGPARRLAGWGWALLAVAVGAGLPGGAAVWSVLSAGLVRYPARLLLVAAVVLPVAAAVAAARGRATARRSLGLGLAAAGAGVLLGVSWPAAGGQAAALVGALAGPWPGAALAGASLLVPYHLPALRLSRPQAVDVPCLASQLGPGRVWSLEPSREQLDWLRDDPDRRAAALGYGYTPLRDGRTSARSFAPLSARSTAAHLAAADAGPAGRWWLDSLGARRLVAQRRLAGFPVVCESGGVVVMDNPGAWPETAVAAALPSPGDRPLTAGAVLRVESEDADARWEVAVDAGGGLLLRLATPDPGWRWRVDGRRAVPQRGPGIVHGVAVPPGRHRVEARYLPPGLVAGAALSVLALIVTGVAWRRW